ncbi:unnamed protein product [Amoebophrya sp. A120]|nr:unnamed protein product [Amoebophrya sp. A120]|eukprot:GSA120T00008227001.1
MPHGGEEIGIEMEEVVQESSQVDVEEDDVDRTQVAQDHTITSTAKTDEQLPSSSTRPSMAQREGKHRRPVSGMPPPKGAGKKGGAVGKKAKPPPKIVDEPVDDSEEEEEDEDDGDSWYSESEEGQTWGEWMSETNDFTGWRLLKRAGFAGLVGILFGVLLAVVIKSAEEPEQISGDPCPADSTAPAAPAPVTGTCPYVGTQPAYAVIGVTEDCTARDEMSIKVTEGAGEGVVVTRELILDANWLWASTKDAGQKNCYGGKTWGGTGCEKCNPKDSVAPGGPNAADEEYSKACGEQMQVNYPTTAQLKDTYGLHMDADKKGFTIDFYTQTQYGATVGGRYFIGAGVGSMKYKLYNLMNMQFSFTTDVSSLECGLNGALYFVSMEEDGGYSKGNPGADYGSGYCDAQCPHDVKYNELRATGKHQFSDRHVEIRRGRNPEDRRQIAEFFWKSWYFCAIMYLQYLEFFVDRCSTDEEVVLRLSEARVDWRLRLSFSQATPRARLVHS